MTPRENMTNYPQAGNNAPALMTAKAASTICLLAGIWYFVSPWVYAGATNANATNNWIVGGAIILVSCFRIARPAYSANLGWANLALGAWAFFSPWIYGYTANDARFWNSIAVGAAVFILAIWAGGVGNRPRLARP